MFGECRNTDEALAWIRRLWAAQYIPWVFNRKWTSADKKNAGVLLRDLLNQYGSKKKITLYSRGTVIESDVEPADALCELMMDTSRLDTVGLYWDGSLGFKFFDRGYKGYWEVRTSAGMFNIDSRERMETK